MSPSPRFTPWLFAALLVFAPVVFAAPETGRPMPAFLVDDLVGQRHSPGDFTGQWTLAVVITDKDAGDSMRAWWQTAEQRLPEGGSLRRTSMVALDIMGIVPTSTILGRARRETPRERWGAVWLSRDGSLAEALGLPESETPWAIVISPEGRVVAMVHAHAGEAAAEAVWRSIPR